MICIFIFINIHNRIGPEINGIGACCKATVVIIRIHHLHGQCFPAAGGTAIKKSCPAFANTPEHFFYIWNQLISDGVTVRAQVCRIHRIRIVVVGIGVLDQYDNEPRKIVTYPFFVEIIRLLLHDFIVSFKMKPFAVIRFKTRIRWLRPESTEIARKVTVKNHERIPGFRMRIETLRQQHMCSQLHRAAPEFG